MMRPVLAEFDPSMVTPFKMLRSMPAELRGVVTNLHDALRELRSTVFRAGQLVLADGQVATQAWLDGDILARTLPTILQSGFMARDDDGALFTPHLYARLLHKEEREPRKTETAAQLQDSGDMSGGMSRKMVTARQNGGAGGRPRKGESAEQARARRARGVEQQQAQRHMPIVASVAGRKTETQTKNPMGCRLRKTRFPQFP